MSTPTQESAYAQEGQAAVLAFIAGYIDAYALLKYRIYASVMSGNSTQIGLRAGGGRLAEAGHALLPIPAFVVGVFVATLLVAGQPRHPSRRLCGLVAALLSAGLAAAYLDPLGGWFSTILLCMAMGVLNTVLDHVGRQAVRVGFVTGDLLSLGQQLARAVGRLPMSDSEGPWDTHWSRAILLAGVWCSFVMGALVSGLAMTHFGPSVLLPPTLMLLVLVVCDRDTRRPAGPVDVASSTGTTANAMAQN